MQRVPEPDAVQRITQRLRLECRIDDLTHSLDDRIEWSGSLDALDDVIDRFGGDRHRTS